MKMVERIFLSFPAPGPVAPVNGGPDGGMMMMCMGWMLLALVLFFMRPASLSVRGDRKPSNNQASHSNNGWILCCLIIKSCNSQVLLLFVTYVEEPLATPRTGFSILNRLETRKI